MQYIALLGASKYDEVITYFSGEKENEFYVTPYVQTAIYSKYKDQISNMTILATETAWNKHGNKLAEQLGTENVIKKIIQEDQNAEEYITSLLNTMINGEEIILDITHGFRHIPIKILFIMKYLEDIKNVKIKHLYYGKILNYERPEDRECEIVDFISDYDMQNISHYLGQFQRTLIIKAKDWEPFTSSDTNVQALFSAMAKFNDVVELNEVDQAVDAVNGILKAAKKLENQNEKGPNSGKYNVLLPLTSQVKEMLDFSSERNNLDKKVRLIRLLIEKDRLQTAITMIDQIYREQLVEACFGTLDGYRLRRKAQLPSWHADPVYTLSQIIKKGVTSNDYTIVLNDSMMMDCDPDVVSRLVAIKGIGKKTKDFYNKIRNSTSHGQALGVKEKDQLKSKLEEMLQLIKDVRGLTA